MKRTTTVGVSVASGFVIGIILFVVMLWTACFCVKRRKADKAQDRKDAPPSKASEAHGAGPDVPDYCETQLELPKIAESPRKVCY
jgi:hypothetical protein